MSTRDESDHDGDLRDHDGDPRDHHQPIQVIAMGDPRDHDGRNTHYALNQWSALTVALSDARIPVDNNASERALRVVALGRKNYLFVGHPKAGQNTAMLYSLVASCEANGVNPEAYLADVLLRVQTHPAARIEELLPHRWMPAAA
jgi:transposase